jgi:hypothetical protein
MEASEAIEIDEPLVLHTLRVRGFVTPDGFRESIGAHPGELLATMVEAGQVRHIENACARATATREARRPRG